MKTVQQFHQDINAAVELEDALLLGEVKFMIQINQSIENCLKANKSLSKVIEKDPKNADAISTLGLIFYYHGKFQKSIELFDLSLAIKPKTQHTIEHRKNASEFKKIFDQLPDETMSDNLNERQMKLVEDGLKIDPSHVNAKWRLMKHQTYGFMGRKRYESAVKGFNYLIDMNPLASFFLERARCYMRLEMFLDASIDLTEAEMILPAGARDTKKIKKMKKEISRVYVPKNLYEVLGVKRNSTHLEIELGYKQLKLAHEIYSAMTPIGHKKRKLETKFEAVEKAYVVLGDKKSRAEYNQEMDKRMISWPFVAVVMFLLSVSLFVIVSSIQVSIGRLNDAMGSVEANGMTGIEELVFVSFMTNP